MKSTSLLTYGMGAWKITKKPREKDEATNDVVENYKHDVKRWEDNSADRRAALLSRLRIV